jgi:hypothetical protein
MQDTTITATNQPAILLELKDLRIGNALLYKGNPVHVTLLSCDIDDEYEETIGFCQWGKTSNEMAGWNRALCAELQPILLTSEVLNKCGFETVEIDFDDEGYSEGYLLRGRTSVGLKPTLLIADNSTDWSTYIEFNVGMGFNHFVDGGRPQYLHDLQNLYFTLTRNELMVTW